MDPGQARRQGSQARGQLCLAAINVAACSTCARPDPPTTARLIARLLQVGRERSTQNAAHAQGPSVACVLAVRRLVLVVLVCLSQLKRPTCAFSSLNVQILQAPLLICPKTLLLKSIRPKVLLVRFIRPKVRLVRLIRPKVRPYVQKCVLPPLV